MRNAAPALALLLAGCGSAGSAPQALVRDASIACALDGAKQWREDCTAEQVHGGLVIHHPDGGFRRLVLTPGGYEAADGAQAVQASISGGMVEITLGADRYRIAERKGE
jgi:hypothetical protein